MAAEDRNLNFPVETSSADNAFTITPHNTDELAFVTRAIYVGTTGDVKVTTKTGNTVIFVGVPAGQILPVRAKIVFATLTTASNLVGLF